MSPAGRFQKPKEKGKEKGKKSPFPLLLFDFPPCQRAPFPFSFTARLFLVRLIPFPFWGARKVVADFPFSFFDLGIFLYLR